MCRRFHKRKRTKKKPLYHAPFPNAEYDVLMENVKITNLPLKDPLNKKATIKYEITANVPELKK